MSIERRAAVHAALAEPVRLAMTDALLLGDRSPGELGEQTGLSTSLLAHHLRVLQEAGVVERSRSEADRRRSYVRLRPQALAGLGPAAVSVAAPRVLFVCTHNSARSQLAAALWQQASAVPAASAGTAPASRVHPGALATARRHGLRLDPRATAHLDQTLEPGDFLVAVCDNAYEQLEHRPHLHWSVPDPVAVGSDQAFEEAFADLHARIGRLTTALTPADPPDDTDSAARPPEEGKR
ncbi:ArsR family transcriptional regulator [Sphaerisporangium album]|nr:ArsR family transcriptional regulator [Sphaerisporangium album]